MNDVREQLHTTLAIRIARAIAPAVDGATDALLLLSSKIRRCADDMKLLFESLHHELARQSFGRRWARGPRRGNGMRRRAVYLKARRP